MMLLLVKLLLAHFVGDFMLQPKKWVDAKEKIKARSPRLFQHILIHGLLILLVLNDLNLWPFALILMLIHGLIDITKLYAQNEKNRTQWFLIDQVLHITSILVMWYVWFEPNIDFDLLNHPIIWIYATALVFLTFVCGIVLQVIMAKWTKSLKENIGGSLSNAGKFIGILERLFVFTFVVTGHWEAIGFLLAAKSVFRFGDLKESKDRKLTEYILIGTLLSFGIAIATGIAVQKVMWLY